MHGWRFLWKMMFRVASWFIPKDLEKLFRYKVFKMLLSRNKITEDLIGMMMGWRHSGFNVYCGPRIQPGEEEAMENLARYIIRASFFFEMSSFGEGCTKVCKVNDSPALTGALVREPTPTRRAPKGGTRDRLYPANPPFRNGGVT
jgi:hypothetical protein